MIRILYAYVYEELLTFQGHQDASCSEYKSEGRRILLSLGGRYNIYIFLVTRRGNITERIYSGIVVQTRYKGNIEKRLHLGRQLQHSGTIVRLSSKSIERKKKRSSYIRSHGKLAKLNIILQRWRFFYTQVYAHFVSVVYFRYPFTRNSTPPLHRICLVYVDYININSNNNNIYI